MIFVFIIIVVVFIIYSALSKLGKIHTKTILMPRKRSRSVSRSRSRSPRKRQRSSKSEKRSETSRERSSKRISSKRENSPQPATSDKSGTSTTRKKESLEGDLEKALEMEKQYKIKYAFIYLNISFAYSSPNQRRTT